jgi:hypothetical protein
MEIQKPGLLCNRILPTPARPQLLLIAVEEKGDEKKKKSVGV